MTEEQIKHMTDRFLGWYLPKDFRPDAGVSYKPGDPRHPGPSGTNLLDGTQAEAMVRYMVEGLPAASAGAVAWIWFNNDVANGRRDNVGIYDHDLPPAKRELGWTSIPLYAQPPADLVGVLADAAADFLEVIAQEGEHGADHYDDDCAICRSWKRLHDASLPTRAPEEKS